MDRQTHIPTPSQSPVQSACRPGQTDLCEQGLHARPMLALSSGGRSLHTARLVPDLGPHQHTTVPGSEAGSPLQGRHSPGAPHTPLWARAQPGQSWLAPTGPLSPAREVAFFPGRVAWGSVWVCRAVSKGAGMPGTDSLPKRRLEQLVGFLFTEASKAARAGSPPPPRLPEAALARLGRGPRGWGACGCPRGPGHSLPPLAGGWLGSSAWGAELGQA